MRIPRRGQNDDPLEAWVDERSDLDALARGPRGADDELLRSLALAEDSSSPYEMSAEDAARILDAVRPRIRRPQARSAARPRVLTVAAAIVLTIAALFALRVSPFRAERGTRTSQGAIVKTVRFEMASSGKLVRLEITVHTSGEFNAR